MTADYRRRFVQLTMLLSGTVLAVMLCVVGLYMHHDYYRSLENTMAEVVKPLGFFRFDRGQRQDMFQPQETPPPDKASEKGENQKDIVTIFYGSGGLTVLGDNSLFSEEVLEQAAEEISNADEDFGTLSELGLIYYRNIEGPDGLMRAAIASNAYTRQSMLRLLLILLAIFAGGMLLFYFISRRISLLAVRPLEEAMAREKQFISDASHDLKTPLTVILANDSILRSHLGETVPEQLRWLDGTRDAAKNMQGLVDEMLTLSRVEAAAAAPPARKVDFSSVVMKSALQLESVAFEKGIELETDIAPEICVSGSGEYLQRVSSSLIENALKYEPPGGQVLVRLFSSGSQAVLTVENRSTVISSEDLPHIFERFYRSDKSRQSQSGHGLGLAIVRSMTEFMGGKVSAESAPETGTVFRVSFQRVFG